MAARPEDRLVVKLLATSAVTAIVSTRITPSYRPELASLPAITFRRTSTNDYGGLDTIATEGWVGVRINCLASGSTATGRADQAWSLAEAVRTALNGLKDATGTPKINYVRFLDAQEPEDIDDLVHVVSVDFRVEWYT